MKKIPCSLLIFIILLTACTTETTLVTPTLAPVTPTRIPATATLAISAISSPTLALPTFSFNSTPFATPTSVGNDPFSVVARIDEIFPDSEWVDIQSAQNGTVWLLTDQGIARMSDAGWTIYLSGYEGYLIGIDSMDQAWVISETRDSISVWDGTMWTKYSGENGWEALKSPEDLGMAVAPGQYIWMASLDELPGQIWLSTREDVRRFDGVRWKIFKLEEMGLTQGTKDPNFDPFPLPLIGVEAIQSTGEVWVGECDSWPNSLPFDGSGARWFDGKSWRGKSTPVESGCVHSIQEDAAGNIWMAVNFSLWRFTPSTQAWANFTLTEFSAHSQSFIFDIAISDAGEPWLITQALCPGGGACTSRTLYHLEEGVWRPVGSITNVSINLGAVLSDSAGTIWLLPSQGESGFYRIVDNIPQLVSNLIVNDWTMDTTGRIWVIGKAGQEDKESLWLATE